MPTDQTKMHCPGCGAPALLTQRFCRSCGFSLEKITEAVAEQLASPELLNEKIKLQKRQQKIQRSLLVAGGSFVALIVMSMLSGLIYLMAVGSLPLVPGVILLILMLTGIVAGSLGTYSERLKRTLADPHPVTTGMLPQSDPGLQLEDHEGPMMSVTERTTNLLESNLNASSTPRKEGGA